MDFQMRPARLFNRQSASNLGNWIRARCLSRSIHLDQYEREVLQCARERSSIMSKANPSGQSQISKFSVLLVSASMAALAGCAAIQVHLGMKVYLAKTPVSSIDVRQAKAPGIGPGQKSSLVVAVTEPNGKVLLTAGAGGKIMWQDLSVTATVVSVNKKGQISLPHDPRATFGMLPHVKITVPSHPGLSAELDVPLRYDFSFGANFSGSDGSNGSTGNDGQTGSSGSAGSTDPNSPSPGGNGGNGTAGSDGGNGEQGGNAPAVQIQIALAPGTHPLLQFAVFAAGHERYYLVDPNGGSLTVRADGGSGGQAGKGGRGGRGGSGGIGTPNGSDGSTGSDGRDGMAGSDGRGGAITVTYDPAVEPYFDTLRISSRNGPRPAFQKEPVAPLW
jgi:hypothetical protein